MFDNFKLNKFVDLHVIWRQRKGLVGTFYAHFISSKMHTRDEAFLEFDKLYIYFIFLMGAKSLLPMLKSTFNF